MAFDVSAFAGARAEVAHVSSSVPTLVRDAAARGDYAVVVEVLATRPLELWFGLTPPEVYEVLSSLPPEALQRDHSVALILSIFSPQSIAGQLGADPARVATIEADPQLRGWYVFAQASQARLAGDPTTAYELMQSLPEVMEPMPQLIDSSFGFRPFLFVQTALSAALAGRFSEALALYTKSTVVALPPALSFFTREAYLRTAMIHALYGDPKQAAVALAHAQQVPRTDSWVEVAFDAEERIVRALLAPRGQLDDAVDRLLEVQLRDVGEMWPFYVAAVRRVSDAAGRSAEGRERLTVLQAAGMGVPVGRGFAGSVIPLALALDAIFKGQVGAARELLASADETLWLTDLLRATHAVTVGAPAQALALGTRVVAQTRGLRQADRWRRHVLAIAQYAARDVDEAIDTLRDLVSNRDSIDAAVLEALAPGLFDLALAHLGDGLAEAETSAVPVEARRALAARGHAPIVLTQRERDVLAELALGKSRDQIARAFYLSVNTVKTHQRNLYRKLEAPDAATAVRIARARGLL